MPKKRKDSVEVVPSSFQEQDSAKEVAESNFKPELHADLAEPLSTVVVVPAPEEEFVEEEVNDGDGSDVVASSTLGDDPKADVAVALLRVGKFYNESGVLSDAITSHLRATAAEPELHSFLQRIQLSLGEFRHQFEQYEGNMSDRLRNAIQDALT